MNVHRSYSARPLWYQTAITHLDSLSRTYKCSSGQATNICCRLLAAGFLTKAKALGSVVTGYKRKAFKEKYWFQFTTLIHKLDHFSTKGNVNHDYLSHSTEPGNIITQENGAWYDQWCGWLMKKQTHKLIRRWQKRYFVINRHHNALSYYASPNDSFPLGFIPFQQIIHCKVDNDKKHRGRRLDLLCNRKYALLAPTKEDADNWASAINQATTDYRIRSETFNGGAPATLSSYTPREGKNLRTMSMPTGILFGPVDLSFLDKTSGRHNQAFKYSLLMKEFFKLNYSVGVTRSGTDILMCALSFPSVILCEFSKMHIVSHKTLRA